MRSAASPSIFAASGNTPEEFGKQIAADLDTYETIVKNANIPAK